MSCFCVHSLFGKIFAAARIFSIFDHDSISKNEILINMKLVFITTLFYFCFLSFSGQAQSNRSYVKQDESIDKLIDEYRQSNRSKGMQGFRVQIFTASGNRSKLLTDREQAIFDSSYPGVRSYITYDEPYFKLRVGDFRTRLDAERFLKQISSKYIYAIVVTDRINWPRLNASDGSGMQESNE
jgi:hypothetical protein